MSADVRSTTVLGDLHLTRASGSAAALDFAELLDAKRGQQVVVAGDLFDLTVDAPQAERQASVEGILRQQPKLRQAIGEFLDADGALWLLGGNHDADLGRNDVGSALLNALGRTLPGTPNLQMRPWFMREGGLHIEHGHFYDPDNAPAHPLVVGEASLGVHFSSEFIQPTGAHHYLLDNDNTPLKLFISSFTHYGPRAPHVIYRYFHAAFSALAKSGPFYRAHGERKVGAERLARYALDAGIPASTAEAVLSVGATSTLESWSSTISRIYMDRVVATLLMGGGVAALARGHRVAGGLSSALGAMLMTLSWMQGHSRYKGSVVSQLDVAARAIKERTGAELVIFGHTHREALRDGYANTGSFGFPRDAPGRPFLEIMHTASGPQARRCYHRRAAS